MELNNFLKRKPLALRARTFAVHALGGLMILGLSACSDDDDEDNNGVNLRQGAVYSMSNERGNNEIVAFSRADDGMLTLVGSFPTGGSGSGSFEDTVNGLVLGSANGEAAPNNYINESELLFATNAGDNTISVFQVEEQGLNLVETQNSNGEKPVSLTVSNGLLYVLNSGETTDDLFDSNGDVIPNCTTGGLPTITGFRVSEGGELTPIPNSTRKLSGDAISGCAQVSFNPAGDTITVTERTARAQPGPPGPGSDEGVIINFPVNPNGALGPRVITRAAGQGPFGFAYTGNTLVTTEQFDGPVGIGLGAVSSYTLNSDGTLNLQTGSINNGGTDTCWIVTTDDGRYGYATSFFEGGRLSSYRISQTGGISLMNADISPEVKMTASDLSLSKDSDYLYQKQSGAGTINAFAVNDDGSLTFIQTVQAHPASMESFERIGLAAY